MNSLKSATILTPTVEKSDPRGLGEPEKCLESVAVTKVADQKSIGTDTLETRKARQFMLFSPFCDPEIKDLTVIQAK